SSCEQLSAIEPPNKNVAADEKLLEDLERAAFRFFWKEASSNTDLVKDRALVNGGDTRSLASIASTGFGLTALCIGAERRYESVTEIRKRVRSTLEFLLNSKPLTVNGFFYHFIDMNSGARAPNSELSSIDTAILLCGVLTARKYFQDAQITSLATQIYERVDWPWMLNGGPTFSMAWKPEDGFTQARWDTYNELMMLYLLAIGSPTKPIGPSAWAAWKRPTVEYKGIRYISGAAPLFIHQYSHAWFDFRNKRDAYANYFENSVKATRAHMLFCLSLADQFPDYTEKLWGITASDSVHGYVAWGGPPAEGPIDGTVVPAAAAGSLPFVPGETLKVLRTIRERYPKAWGEYGFVDAFNPLTHWVNPDVIGIDTGISMLMAENARTGFVWKTFMKNPEVQKAMKLAGFH
ncbi:MAG TPA: glucoamylase family protein, partial [Candidatus Angelobacter sp.]|nr:glucoamylase family protein [Candidatus Angelobacter sp.]